MKMDVVILAAGKGNRLKPLTNKTPKTLIKIGDKPIIEMILDSLPENKIKNVFVVTKHLEDKINKYLQIKKTKYKFSIETITQGEEKGTYGALLSSKKYIGDWFMVLNGDDIHSKKYISRFFNNQIIIGVSKKISNYFEVIFDKEKNFEKFERMSKKKNKYIATGCYTLDKDFFKLTPEKTSEGEFGIPQTIEANLDKLKPKILIEKDWHQLNTLKDLEYLNKIFK